MSLCSDHILQHSTALKSRKDVFVGYSSSLTKQEGKSTVKGSLTFLFHLFFDLCCSVTRQLFFALRHTPSNLCSQKTLKGLIKEGDIRTAGDCLFYHETLSVEALQCHCLAAADVPGFCFQLDNVLAGVGAIL